MSSGGREFDLEDRERSAREAEDNAYANASARPVKRAVARDETIEFARRLGKVVIARSRRKGASETEISAMKGRMSEFVKAVLAHQQGIEDLHALGNLDAETKAKLAADMRRGLTEQRIQIFGMSDDEAKVGV